MSVFDKIPLLKNPEDFPDLNIELLTKDPPLCRIKGLLSPAECLEIIEYGRPKLAKSFVIKDNKRIMNDQRESKTAFLNKSGTVPEHPLLKTLVERCSALTSFGTTHFEGLKIVHYEKGQYYKAHWDYLKDHPQFIKDTGDRIITFFLYLNSLSPEDGGATFFPKLGLRSQAQAGEAAFWMNFDFESQYFEKSLHAGEAIRTDVEKWGMNIWIRERAYKLK